MEKTIILGLDGGTWRILEPLIKEGKAPFFSRLIKNGTYGILKSTIPPVTAPAWTSFLTGKNPGKHGLFDFQKIDFQERKRRLTFSNDCKSATILDYLTDAGKRCLFVNVPLTYPPQPINGIIIAGFPVPPDTNFVYPPDLQDSIRELDYITDWMELYKTKKNLPKASLIKMVDFAQINVFSSLMQQEEWDVAMIVVSGTDHIGHLAWQQGKIKDVKKHYMYVDSMLMDLQAKGIFNNANIIVMSDHGFGGADYSFLMNTWLNSEGYLFFESAKQENYDLFLSNFRRTVYGEKRNILAKIFKFINLNRENLIYIGKKTGLIRLEQYLPHSLISIFPSQEFSIDWTRTKAYMVSNASKGLNINLVGREWTGIVSPSEYDSLRSEIIAKLKELKDGKGNPIMAVADIRENVYSGPYISEAPDILTWPYPNYKIRMGAKRKNFLRRVTEAQHEIDGIFIFSGPNFRAGENSESIYILDIAPTVLHTMGLPVPDDMDGKVRTEFFSPEMLSSTREVTYRPPILKEPGKPGEADEFESAETMEKLKTLGYM